MHVQYYAYRTTKLAITIIESIDREYLSFVSNASIPEENSVNDHCSSRSYNLQVFDSMKFIRMWFESSDTAWYI